jgi:flagellar basal-body rod protein FlgB
VRSVAAEGHAVDVTDSPFFAALKANLNHLGTRQKLIAENIANATTPGYVPRDTNEKAFGQALAAYVKSSDGPKLTMASTEGGHLGGAKSLSDPKIAARIVSTADSETTIDGNAVVLEDQMLRQTETRSAYETSIALYQKGLQLIRLASKAPGR